MDAKLYIRNTKIHPSKGRFRYIIIQDSTEKDQIALSGYGEIAELIDTLDIAPAAEFSAVMRADYHIASNTERAKFLLLVKDDAFRNKNR